MEICENTNGKKQFSKWAYFLPCWTEYIYQNFNEQRMKVYKLPIECKLLFKQIFMKTLN